MRALGSLQATHEPLDRASPGKHLVQTEADELLQALQLGSHFLIELPVMEYPFLALMQMVKSGLILLGTHTSHPN